MIHLSKLLLGLFSIVLLSCTGQEKKQEETNWDNKQSITWNKSSSKKELRTIAKYGERQGWKLSNTGSGAHYWVYKEVPNPIFPKEGESVQVKMVISLMSGDTCYSTDNYGAETILVGKDQSEAGLHEVLPLLPYGSKSKVVLPSYLAFGVAGDQDKIPPLSTVVYDIEVLPRTAK